MGSTSRRNERSAAVQAPDETAHFDETADSPEQAPSRPGALLSAIKLLVGGLMVTGITAALFWSVYRYAVTSPRFAIRSIEVEGNARLSDARIVELGGLHAGSNIFAADLSAAEKRLLDDPWLKSVQIVRELPTGLQIKVVERTAAAVASIADGLHLITTDGEPFKQVGPGEAFDLPLITGLSLAGLARDRAREIERAQVAVEVLKQYGRLDLSRVHPPQEVHLHEDGRLTLIVGSRGLHLELGRGSWRSKLLMAVRVLAKLTAKGELPEVVFLDNEAHPERVVVRLR